MMFKTTLYAIIMVSASAIAPMASAHPCAQLDLPQPLEVTTSVASAARPGIFLAPAEDGSASEARFFTGWHLSWSGWYRAVHHAPAYSIDGVSAAPISNVGETGIYRVSCKDETLGYFYPRASGKYSVQGTDSPWTTASFKVAVQGKSVAVSLDSADGAPAEVIAMAAAHLAQQKASELAARLAQEGQDAAREDEGSSWSLGGIGHRW